MREQFSRYVGPVIYKVLGIGVRPTLSEYGDFEEFNSTSEWNTGHDRREND